MSSISGINGANLGDLVVTNEANRNANWNGKAIEKSETAKNFNVVTAFACWVSETVSAEQQKYEEDRASQDIDFARSLPAELNETDRYFITRNLRDFNGPWTGRVSLERNEVKERLQALSGREILKEVFKDPEYKNEWSFYAMTQVPGTERAPKMELQWVKNGELYSCIIDVCSQAPKVLVIEDEGEVIKTYDSVPEAVGAQIGTKRIPLAILNSQECAAAVQKAVVAHFDKKPVEKKQDEFSAVTDTIVREKEDKKEKTEFVYALFGEKEEGDDIEDGEESDGDTVAVLDFRVSRKKKAEPEDASDAVNDTGASDESVSPQNEASEAEESDEEEAEEVVEERRPRISEGMLLRSGKIYYPEKARLYKYRHFKLPPRYTI